MWKPNFSLMDYSWIYISMIVDFQWDATKKLIKILISNTTREDKE